MNAVIEEIRERFGESPEIEVQAASLSRAFDEIQASTGLAIDRTDTLIRTALDAITDQGKLLPEMIAILSDFVAVLEAMQRQIKATEEFRDHSPTITAELDRIVAAIRDRAELIRLAIAPEVS